MTPTIIFCSWLAGRCFALNIDAVPAEKCEEAIVQVVDLKDNLTDRGVLPVDLFLYKKECVW